MAGSPLDPGKGLEAALRKAPLFVLLLTVQACGGMSVHSAHDPEVDLGAMSTYDWMDRPQREVSRRATREGLDQRIRTAVDQGLEAKGFRRAPAAEADLIFTYYVGLDGDFDVMLVNTYPDDRFGVGRGWDRYTERSDRRMESGTMVLDALDGRTGKLAWRGVAEAEIDRTDTPEKRAALVNEAVRRLLEEFPGGG